MLELMKATPFTERRTAFRPKILDGQELVRGLFAHRDDYPSGTSMNTAAQFFTTALRPPTFTTTLWSDVSSEDLYPGWDSMIIIEIDPEPVQAFTRATTPTSANLVPAEEQDDDADPAVWRGVFTPRRERTVLFTQLLEFRTDDLPRPKRRVRFEGRTSMNEDG